MRRRTMVTVAVLVLSIAGLGVFKVQQVRTAIACWQLGMTGRLTAGVAGRPQSGPRTPLPSTR